MWPRRGAERRAAVWSARGVVSRRTSFFMSILLFMGTFIYQPSWKVSGPSPFSLENASNNQRFRSDSGDHLHVSSGLLPRTGHTEIVGAHWYAHWFASFRNPFFQRKIFSITFKVGQTTFHNFQFNFSRRFFSNFPFFKSTWIFSSKYEKNFKISKISSLSLAMIFQFINNDHRIVALWMETFWDTLNLYFFSILFLYNFLIWWVNSLDSKTALRRCSMNLHQISLVWNFFGIFLEFFWNFLGIFFSFSFIFFKFLWVFFIWDFFEFFWKWFSLHQIWKKYGLVKLEKIYATFGGFIWWRFLIGE